MNGWWRPFLLRRENTQNSQLPIRWGLSEWSAWPGPLQKAPSYLCLSAFLQCPSFSPCPLSPVEDSFLECGQVTALIAGLKYCLSPCCMRGDCEQLEKSASPAGKTWVLCSWASGTQQEPHAPQPVRMEERKQGLSSPVEFAVIGFISSNFPLQNGFSSGPSNPGVSKMWPTVACFYKVLIERSYSVTYILCITIFVLSW